LIRAFLFAALLMWQSPGPPPEPPANAKACHNYHDSEKDNCHCPKAMRSDGSGGEAVYPDTSKGESWCSTYCAHKCACISPMKHVMPSGR
jgi:hypothetical protein